MKKAAEVFKRIVNKVKAAAESPRVMRHRDKKALLTKAMLRYTRTKLAPLKLVGEFKPAHLSNPNAKVVYEIILTPGSPMAFVYFTRGGETIPERLTIPRLSDFFVVNGAFELLNAQLKDALK